jgi:hypothetical protein
MGAKSGQDGTIDVTVVDASGSAGGLSVNPYPAGAVPVTASSGAVANASSTLNLPGVAGKTTYMTGLEVTGLGATAAGSVTVSIYLAGSALTLYFVVPIPAGVTTGISPLIVQFPTPISAGGANAVIQTTMPAFGSGNTAACLNVHGFQL